MNKQVIGIDIDDVLSSQTEVLIEFSNSRYNMNLTIDDFKEPGEYWGYYEQVWNVGKEEGSRRFQEFLDKKVPLTQVIKPDAVEVIQKLSILFRLEIITSRGADYQPDTVKWIESHVPGIFDGIHFVELWNKGGQKATKAAICQEIGAGYLIDDNLEHCELAAEVGVKALLFGEFGWNKRQVSSPNITRVNNWQAVAEYFNV